MAALTQQDHINMIEARIAYLVAGPPPISSYYNAVVQAILPNIPTYYQFATAAVPPDANGNYTFSKVELIDLIASRIALMEILAFMLVKVRQVLDGFLLVDGYKIFDNIKAAVQIYDNQIEICRKRIRDSRVPVLAEILRLSPVRADMPVFTPGPGQPALESPTQPDPNDQAYVGAPIYDSDDPHQPLLPGPFLDQPGQPEGW